MKHTLIWAGVGLTILAGCETPPQTIIAGQYAGAAIGAATAGASTTPPVMLGMMAGMAAGAAYEAANAPPMCRFVYPDGSERIAEGPCPNAEHHDLAQELIDAAAAQDDAATDF